MCRFSFIKISILNSTRGKKINGCENVDLMQGGVDRGSTLSGRIYRDFDMINQSIILDTVLIQAS